ncbi:MAG: GspMb/PilO family protein [Thermomonas sp.]
MASSRLTQRLAELREEWRANTRLRWGGGAIAAILFVYLVLVLVDWRRELHAQYQQRTAEVYKMMALAGQDQWLMRAGQAQQLRGGLDAEIPSTSTIGLAQAEAQSTLRQILSAFGRDLNTNAVEPSQVAGQPGLWRVPITISGIVQPRLLLEILRRIEGNQRLITIEEFSLDIQGDRPNLTMTAVAYYRIAKGKEGQNVAR